jgi:hypothetical protein
MKAVRLSIFFFSLILGSFLFSEDLENDYSRIMDVTGISRQYDSIADVILSMFEQNKAGISKAFEGCMDDMAAEMIRQF